MGALCLGPVPWPCPDSSRPSAPFHPFLRVTHVPEVPGTGPIPRDRAAAAKALAHSRCFAKVQGCQVPGIHEGRAALATLASAQGGPTETCRLRAPLGGPSGLQAGTRGAAAAARPFQTPRPCCPAVGPWPGSPAPLLTTLVFSLGWPHPPRPGSRPPLPGGPPCCFPACLWVISLCPWLAPVLPATAGLLISLLPGGGSRMAKWGGPGPWRLRPALQGPRRKPLLWPVTWAWQGVPLGAAGLSRACP